MIYNQFANMSGFNENLDWNDPDDIFREIDEEDEGACQDEIRRLKKKRKGIEASFNEGIKIINNLIKRPVKFTTVDGAPCFAACYTLFKNCLNLSMKYTVTTNMPFPFICG